MKHYQVKETFNCAFPLFLASTSVKVDDARGECRIGDHGQDGSKTFHHIIEDIAQGELH